MAHTVTAFAPGRVNLIGEHTDYNDGLALPFAIDRGVTVEVRPDDGAEIAVLAANLGERDHFPVEAPSPSTGWRAFVRGTVAELRAEGVVVGGADLTIGGDLPRGAGLSSSAALVVSLCLALLEASGVSPPDAVQLARLCSRVETRWAGARTGLLDPLAILCAIRGHAVEIDFRTLAVEPVALRLGEWALVTVDSGAPRPLTASPYNERRRECEQVLEVLGLSSMRDARRQHLHRLPEPLERRARHVLDENARVNAVVEALRAGDLTTVGEALSASHRSLRDLYDASVPAVEETVRRLMRGGSAGARMIGGGFGGHVLALLPPGIEPPADATLVTAGAGARLLEG